MDMYEKLFVPMEQLFFYIYWGQFDLIFKLGLILLWPKNTPDGNGNVNSNVI